MYNNETKLESNYQQKISKNLESMLVYYTKDITEEDQSNYLKELLEEIRDELENSFLDIMKNIYNPKMDIQQRILLGDDINKEDIEFFARKLLLLDRAGIQLDIDIYLPLAQYFLLSGYYSDALDLLIRNLINLEYNELTLNILAIIFYKYDKKDESLEILEECIRNKAKEDIIYYNAALLYYMIGNYDKSVEYLDGKDEKLSNRNNFYLCLGDSLYNIGKIEKASLYFEKYLYKNPHNKGVLSKLIDINYELDNYSKTLKYINIFQNINNEEKIKTDYNFIFKKAVALYFTDNIEEAMKILAQYLGIEKTYLEGKGRDYLFGLFVEAFRMGLSDEKVFKIFRNELERENWDREMVNYLISQVKNVEVDDPNALCFLGIIHTQVGNINIAKEMLEEVISKNPNHTEAKNGLGICYYEIGDEKKVIEIYQELLFNNDASRELAFISAKIYIDSGDIHNAKQAAMYSYKRGIKNLEILKMLGYIYIELKELEKALEFYIKAQKIEPHDVEIQNQIGVIYLLKGEYNDAAIIFKRLVKKDPDFGEAHYNLGITYKKILEKEAESHITKFFELSKDDTKKLLVEE